MTRKNYTALAAEIADATRWGVLTPAAARDMARRIADVCAADNPRFSRGRFYAACGVAE